MNKFAYVKYEKSDSNDVTAEDLSGFRLVRCRLKNNPGFFVKRKIKKLTSGFCTLDEKSIADELFLSKPKDLFKQNFVYAVSEFGRIYNLPFSDKEIVVAFEPSDKALSGLSDIFGMVYVSALKRECSLYNVFYTEEIAKRHFDFAVVENAGVSADYIFNLSEKPIQGAVNDISVSAGEFDVISDNAKNSVLCQYNVPFSITGFVR